MLWLLLAIALSSVRAQADAVHPKPILEQETLHAIPGTFWEMSEERFVREIEAVAARERKNR